MTTLDPAYCADGCGRLAETERPMGVTADGDLIVELVCRICVLPVEVRKLATRVRERAAEIRADNRITYDQDMGEL